jgi:hypothetical protein
LCKDIDNKSSVEGKDIHGKVEELDIDTEDGDNIDMVRDDEQIEIKIKKP